MSRAGRHGPGRSWFVRAGAAASALALAAGVAAVPGEPAAQYSVAETGAVRHSGAAPADQIRARQWHLDAMRLPRAWRISKGQGVTVAVLDTGVDEEHPDLVGRVRSGPDLTGGARRPGSRYWGRHGTSMASIIAGHGNGPGHAHGVIGVAPSSRILSVRVTWENDDPQRRAGQAVRNRDAVAQGIRYAVDHGADIVNMSLGGGRLFYDGSSTEESAIRYALDRGVVLIASAGNDGAGPNRNNFPAAYRGVIAVGALDRRLTLWKDSNRRPYVAVCAPGVEIVSADSGNGYVIGTGTSPSSAIVAGVAALIRSRYPRLEPAEVRRALVGGAAPGRPTGSSTCEGPLDAVRALAAASRINRRSGGAEEVTGSPSPTPAVAVEPGEGGNLLLAGVLGGGGLMIGVAVLLGYWQRRRYATADGPDDYYYMGDYGLPPGPSPSHRPPSHPPPSPQPPSRWSPPRHVDALGGHGEPGGTSMAPVNVPVWQSTDVYPPPPSSGEPRTPAEPPSGADEPPARDVPSVPTELHPFLTEGRPEDESNRPPWS